MMISALKMTALRIALWADCRCMTLSTDSGCECDVGGEHRRDDREVFGDVVGDAEGRQRAARDEHLLAGLDDLDELGRIAVEVDEVARLLGRLGPAVHRDADVRLRERRGVVGAVAGHGDELAAGLLLTDQVELVLRRRLREEVVDACLLRRSRRPSAGCPR